eukprot:CAMPEP_0183779488 /NCGR_PEP_ID=MMETSP0739-20130205/53943_1 /TAXON_ID=385413 /ORGANISM="Thalassiosira miniscula, Strain CCMP1093" /LENGTH=42 /DNA_ID= /DNA_START= /DNA_END= /DNA_ORIENTATION=
MADEEHALGSNTTPTADMEGAGSHGITSDEDNATRKMRESYT